MDKKTVVLSNGNVIVIPDNAIKVIIIEKIENSCIHIGEGTQECCRGNPTVISVIPDLNNHDNPG